jgi:coenzyme F420 hydrogenase subunit beta
MTVNGSNIDPKTEAVLARYRAYLEDGVDHREWAYAWRTEINRGGFRAVDFLMEQIVHTGMCVGCASCLTICPADVFDYVDEKPVDSRPEACVFCVLCVEVCPVLRPVEDDERNRARFRAAAVDDGYGPVSYGCYARATDPELVARGQDGGMTSALLIHHLETGRLGGAILGDVIPESRQIGRHRLSTTRQDVLECAASRYTYSPNTLALQEAMRKDIKPLAVVGVPCQIDGVLLQQSSSIQLEMSSWYRENIALTIGLFCSESFTHESIERLAEIIEVKPEEIENINIKGKVVVRLDGGEIINASLKQYGQWARPACLYCLDYGAENADIGAGGIGMDDWTMTVIRTDAGHEAFQAAIDDGVIETRPLEDEPKGDFLAKKLSANKRKNRPLPAQMPTYQERLELDYLDPKTFYTKGPGAPPKEETPAPEGDKT